jgi:NAD(P)-dependent dehydrogenase (short-subunit alcohol dehydrogenase family)
MSDNGEKVDLFGRIAVVTGASTGIGKEVARALAGRRATVVMASRSKDKGEATLREISDDTANPNLSFLQVDTSSFESIEGFVKELRAKFDKVDILVNNAGVWLNERRTNDRGVEATWATNVLGYFALTTALLPLLEAAGTAERRARVINVASEAAGGLDLGDVQFQRRGYSGVAAYKQSKQADRMLSWVFARRLQGKNVTVNAMHPGWVATELFRDGFLGAVAGAASKLLARSPAKGAETAAWLAMSPEVEGETGRFWVDRKERFCRFRDEAKEDALWKLCEDMA